MNGRRQVVETSNFMRGKLVWLDVPRSDDKSVYLQWWQDLEDVQQMFFGPLTPVSMEDIEDRFQRDTERFKNFSIRTIEDNTLIGDLSLMFTDYRNRSVMLGIYIGDKAHRNGGYGSDAIRVGMRYAFLELNVNRFDLGVADFNPARRLYERLGFQYEGTYRQSLFRDSQYHNVHHYSILRDEWLNQMSMS
jgi:RimJ/RimL family protein N-acetyltransferase